MSEEQRDEVVEETGVATLEEGEAGKKMDLKVAIDDVGPCKKHIRVSVPRASIDEAFEELLGEYVERAEVPGFRPGHVPVELVRKRFRKDLNDELADFLTRACASDRSTRFQTAAEMKTELELARASL